MLKRFYLYAWIMLAATSAGSILTGSISEIGMVAYSLVALGLVYALVLWTVIENGRQFEQNSPANAAAGGA